MANSKLKPLITDLKKLHMGYYLKSSKFERLTVRFKFHAVWQSYYEYAKKKRTYFLAGHDHKVFDCEEGFILLVGGLFENDINLLYKIIFRTFEGFIDWNFEEIELNEIFEDLELINFPDDWLKELRKLYLDRVRLILDNAKLNKADDVLVEEKKIKESELLNVKKGEWVRLIEVANLKSALLQVTEFCKSTNNLIVRNKLINLSARLYRIENKVREGLIDLETENLEVNKINKALLEIIDNMK